MKPSGQTHVNQPELTRVCVSCGKSYGSFNPHCPHCGLIPKSRRLHSKARFRLWTLSVLLSLVLLFFLSSEAPSHDMIVFLQSQASIVIASVTSLLLTSRLEKSRLPLIQDLRNQSQMFKWIWKFFAYTAAFVIQTAMLFEIVWGTSLGAVTTMVALALTAAQTCHILSLTPIPLPTDVK